MSDYIKRIRTTTGDKQIDYTALANLPTLVTVDNALTESGKAADAKVVGDKLSALTQRSDANTLKGYAVGQTISVDDVSPIEQFVDVTVTSKNLIDVTKIEVQSSDNIYISAVGEGYIEITTASGYVSNGHRQTYTKLKHLCPQMTPNKYYVLSAETDSTLKMAHLRDVDYFIDFGKPVFITEEMLESYLAFYGLDSRTDTTGGVCRISNIQFEEGSTVTEYTPYVDPSTTTLTYGDKTYTPNSDGSVEGLISTYPYMEMSVPNGFAVRLEYNQDTNVVIKKLTDAIVALGGTV